MNTTTTSRRLAAVGAVVALVAALSGCAGIANAPVADPHARAASGTVVTSAMHRALVQSAADRYVVELLVRARMVTHPVAPIVRAALTPVHGR